MLIEQILKTKGGEVLTIDAQSSLGDAARFLDNAKIGAVVAVNDAVALPSTGKLPTWTFATLSRSGEYDGHVTTKLKRIHDH